MVPYLTRCDRLGNIMKIKYGPLNEVSINIDPKQLFFVTSYDSVRMWFSESSRKLIQDFFSF